MDQLTRLRAPIRVLLIDDSILTLHGLKTFLSTVPHIEILGIARTPSEAFDAIQAHQPNVVMLEARVGQASGIDVCKAMRESHPNIGVLFFTAHDDKELLRAAIMADAHGYLLKGAAAEAVARSIEIVASGRAIMDQQLTQQVITWVRDGALAGQERISYNCSKDDRQLLSLVALGKTNKEIAQELNLVPRVVATRLQKIYKRLKISRRSEAARYYVQLEKDPHGREGVSHQN
ncbi:MAG: response regulator transcription factor [Nitrospira sp. CG24B]|nr:MAG: response regulator transcription factor [Nitrospira sp. CG24B]